MFSIDRSFLYGAFDVFFKSSIFYIGCTFFIASFIFLTCSSTTFFFFRWHGFLKIFLVCGVYLQNQLWLCVYLGNRVRDLNHGRRLSLVICVAKGNQLSSDHYEIKNPVTYLILDSFWSATFKGRQFWFFYQIVNSSKIHGSITKKKKKRKIISIEFGFVSRCRNCFPSKWLLLGLMLFRSYFVAPKASRNSLIRFQCRITMISWWCQIHLIECRISILTTME